MNDQTVCGHWVPGISHLSMGLLQGGQFLFMVGGGKGWRKGEFTLEMESWSLLNCRYCLLPASPGRKRFFSEKRHALQGVRHQGVS